MGTAGKGEMESEGGSDRDGCRRIELYLLIQISKNVRKLYES